MDNDWWYVCLARVRPQVQCPALQVRVGYSIRGTRCKAFTHDRHLFLKSTPPMVCYLCFTSKKIEI